MMTLWETASDSEVASATNEAQEAPEYESEQRNDLLRMAAACNNLDFDQMDGSVETQSEKGYKACWDLLEALNVLMQGIGGPELASRAYREEFPTNYRNLFDGTPTYRVDILEASVSLRHSSVIWANGQLIALDVDLPAEAFHKAWTDLLRSFSVQLPAALLHARQQSPTALQEVCGISGCPSSFNCYDGSSPSRQQQQQQQQSSELLREDAIGGGLRSPRCTRPLPSRMRSSEMLASMPRRDELRALLLRLDAAWATFESSYVRELIRVQEKAKSLIYKAIELERQLQTFEQKCDLEELSSHAGYQAHKRALISCIEHLNLVANRNQKGEEHLNWKTLDASIELLHLINDDLDSGRSRSPLSAIKTIAGRVVMSYEMIREYLRDVQHHMDELHPQLCENPELTERLAALDESWLIGARYLRNASMLRALCSLVHFLRELLSTFPDFAEMLADCTPELFLVLPRLVWLYFFAAPSSDLFTLVKFLLPHHFDVALEESHVLEVLVAAAVDDVPHHSLAPRLGEELRRIISKFWRAESLLGRAAAEMRVDAGHGTLMTTAWHFLVQRAIDPSNTDIHTLLAPSLRPQAVSALEGFMQELEGWSMELQRHRPEDWNECVGVLVDCLQH